jgi:hypothetical protein
MTRGAPGTRAAPLLRRAAGRSLVAATLAVPAAVTLGLAFRSGGVHPGATAVAAAAVALALAARIALAPAPVAPGRALLVLLVAIAGLGLWALLSQRWSHAPGRALVEADRALLATLLAALLGSLPARPGRLDAVLRLVVLAIVAIAVAGLLTRLYPATFPHSDAGLRTRLNFPLTYWNAVGILCGVGLVLAVHAGAGAGQPAAVRVLAAAACPPLAATLLLTYSRGALGATVAGVVAYIVLAHGRRLATMLVAAGLPTAVAVLVTYDAEGLSSYYYRDATGEAHRVAAVLAGCVLAAVALGVLGVRLDGRLRALVPDPHRRRALLRAGAVAAGVAILAGLALGATSGLLGRGLDGLAESGAPPESAAGSRARLLEGGANGRHDPWRVSLHDLGAHPLTGTGAGTFQLEFQQRRRTAEDLADGHSLYLETAGELGLPGLALLLVALGTPLVVAARRLRGPTRHAHAAFLAAALALLLHAAVDRDWEMPVLFAWFWGAAGVVCAAAPSPRRPRRLAGGPRAAAAVACLALAAVPATLAVSQARVDRAAAALAAGDCGRAARAARGAAGVLGSRPEPFAVLGACRLRAGDAPGAEAAFRSAHDRDPRNYAYLYDLALARAASGEDPRPEALAALRRNPRSRDARTLVARLGSAGPADRPRIGAVAPIVPTSG